MSQQPNLGFFKFTVEDNPNRGNVPIEEMWSAYAAKFEAERQEKLKASSSQAETHASGSSKRVDPSTVQPIIAREAGGSSSSIPDSARMTGTSDRGIKGSDGQDPSSNTSLSQDSSGLAHLRTSTSATDPLPSPTLPSPSHGQSSMAQGEASTSDITRTRSPEGASSSGGGNPSSSSKGDATKSSWLNRFGRKRSLDVPRTKSRT